MKVYEITIKPKAGFGTPLKGDTLFGQFCWQIAYDERLIGKTLDELLLDYEERPFAIFSSAYSKFCAGNNYHYVFKTPAMPLDNVFNLPEDKRQKIEKRKECKAKRWMIVKEGQRFVSFKELEFLNDQELLRKAMGNVSDETRKQMRKSGSKSFMASFSQLHNTINRLSGSTGEGGFAPFQVEQVVYYPETELALFVGFDGTKIHIDQILEGLDRIGKSGFGKDASTGLGRFALREENEIDLMRMGSDSPNACYNLSPCVPEENTFEKIFFAPFTRFGRHGDVLAKSSNPFKNPVIMADEGGIFKPRNKDVFNKPFIGRSLKNLSKTEPKTVAQGYSLYLPITVEE